MSIPFEGFTGPSYQLTSRYATIERCVNWLPVVNESLGEKKFKIGLEASPGNAAFSQLPVPAPFNQPCRALIENRGLVYGVNGDTVFQLKSDGTYIKVGKVDLDKNPCSMVANGTGQIFIASADSGYVIPSAGGAGSLVQVGGGFQGASMATFQDGYVLVLTPNSNQFQISGDDKTPLGDATKWSDANISIQAGQADLLRAIISSREYLRLMGARRSQIYQNVGNNGIGGFPFQSYNETFIETGIGAPFSLADFGDSLIWVGEDARGQRACWLDSAFHPTRISNFAVERFWQSYARIDDAVAFPFIWKGHLLYQITFPSAYVNNPVSGFPLGGPPSYTGATWVFDKTVSDLLQHPVWHERSYQTAQGFAQQRSEMFHCYAFGKHLVGSVGIDGNPGAVYQYAEIGTTNKEPQLLLRWSNDDGNTWGAEQNIPLGKVGEYDPRVYWNRAGYARDRVFWLRYADETECGTDVAGAQVQRPIVRDRIAPHLWSNNKRRLYNRVEFEITRGVGSSDGVTPSPFTLGLFGAELDLIELAS